MDPVGADPAEGSSGGQDGSRKASLTSARRTSHAGKQSALGYGVGVVLHQLRPFIPFFIISILVVVLVYLLQTIIYGGPFTDPHFFVKFNERWPRPDHHRVPAVPVPTSDPRYPPDGLVVNGTRG